MKDLDAQLVGSIRVRGFTAFLLGLRGWNYRSNGMRRTMSYRAHKILETCGGGWKDHEVDLEDRKYLCCSPKSLCLTAELVKAARTCSLEKARRSSVWVR